ncbi:MAG: DNA polymerase III subunit beta [Oscillospiraceae bacterium]|nr:DNA polymerase III subunit beta [Oscillospiraceae bacterium]
MKFSCEKVVLQNAINTAGRAVSTKSSIPALEGLLLICYGGSLIVSGYNMQLGIRTRFACDSEEDGALVLNARLFGDIVRRMPDDTLTLVSDDSMTVKLHCGDADFDIQALPAADFPQLPEVEEKNAFSLPEKTLGAMIRQTSFAVSTNESRPVHMGSLFEVTPDELTMVSVDGFRLALRREKLEDARGGVFSFVAPGTALNEVEKVCEDIDEPVKITLGDRHVLFEVGETELICRRLEGEFLDYKNAIPRSNPIHLLVDAKSMIESLERVSVVINEKLKSPVRCRFGDGMVVFSARTANGDAKDVCKYTGDAGDLEIGFNNRYLTEALRYAPAETVQLELNSGISPAIVVPATEGDRSFLYMVLPVRLKA